ncbi:MAG TPA: YeeE/YedE thiosulfate transporter family protein [archaeon]|nr:YeeE/YedE thiosulfate transporter family protein [archaeon]
MKDKPIQKPYMNPYLAGALLGLVLFASFMLTGHGLGASGGLARITAGVVDLVAPRHVDRTAALAEMAGGDQNPYDNWLVWAICGVMLGGFISGLLGKRVRVETRMGPHVSTRKRWLMAFIGGILVGIGARLARGCTSGQALSGGAVLSVGSWAFMMAVFAGGYLLALPVRKLWN